MKKANKISLIVTICLIAMVGISAVFFSVVLAKYVVKQKREKEQATPSNFELIMNSDDATLLYVDFAESGDTSPEVGTRTVFRTYDFSVKTLNSEVESNYVLSIFLPEKLYEKIFAIKHPTVRPVIAAGQNTGRIVSASDIRNCTGP